MKDDLINKIREDIQKTGVGSEMAAMKMFLDANWGCQPGKAYFDHDEKKTREIDLAATTIPSTENVREILFEYHVYAEVKKSERPWIVFSHEDKISSAFGDNWTNPYVAWNLPDDGLGITPILAKTSTCHGLDWMGYGVHEAFKEPNQPSRWYSAAVSACKASADSVTDKKCYSDEVRQVWGKGAFLVMSNPLVILDGLLIRARLDQKAQIQLEQIDFAPMFFEFRTPALKHEIYRLDVFTLQGLPKFIEKSNDRAKQIYDFLKQKCGKLS